MLSISRHRLFIERIPFTNRFYVNYNNPPPCLYFSISYSVYIFQQTQKQNHFGSCFFSNFILLKVLGLDNTARFYQPYLYGFYGVHEISDIWVSIPTVGFFHKYYCPLYFSYLSENKMQHNLSLRAILFTAACSNIERVLKLVITGRAWLDLSKLTILWTISRTKANFLQFLHNFPTHDIFWHIIFLSSCSSWFMTQKCTLSRK